jgi:hypothetical protein
MNWESFESVVFDWKCGLGKLSGVIHLQFNAD